MQFITDALGPFGPIIAVGTLGLVMVVMVIIAMMKQRQDPLERLKESNRNNGRSAEAQKLRTNAKNKKLEKYANFLEPQDEKQLSQVRLLLMQAGYRHRDAVRFFNFAQMALAILFLVVGVVYYILVKAGDDSTTTQAVMWILGPGLVGYMMPKYWAPIRSGSHCSKAPPPTRRTGLVDPT